MFAARAALLTGAPAGATKGSVYFDGSGDYLSVPTTNNGLAFGNGDFSVEMWVRPTKDSNAGPQIFFGSPGGTFRNGIAFGMRYGYMWWLSGDGTQWTFERNVGTALTINTWSHVAVTRSNWLARFYVNGTSIDSLYDYNNLGQGSNWTVGGYVSGYELQGNISNVRVQKGQATYTGASFTPPTAPFSTATAYVTTLLTCQSPTTITDAGIYTLPITAVGNATASSLSPFA